ncbi:hypothetical protein Taro_027649 [Colocasia esculenta]|uniref:DUF4378 domain-containing protein n=1 Tax=Colocasia esculenta TaxID=4460 RepID=A0A843VPE0_COLES|nr:hypothetical protein [Colocasia esculenta]
MASLAGRRLAELLQEQQEPFLLDVYLLENGHSGRILCSNATATCWPGGSTACRRLRRLASHGFQGRGERILGSLLGVFSRRKPPRSSNWGGGSTSIMGAKARSNTEDGRELGKPKVDAERAHVWECTEAAKQLSPVSVLELQSDDGSPAHEHAKEGPSISGLYAQVGAVGVLGGGLHGCSSSHYNMKIHGRRQAPLEEERSTTRTHQSEQREQAQLHESLGSHRREKARRRRHLRRRDAIAVGHLESDVSDYSMRWNQFNPNVMEIGAEVGEALLAELVDDLCLTNM